MQTNGLQSGTHCRMYSSVQELFTSGTFFNANAAAWKPKCIRNFSGLPNDHFIAGVLWLKNLTLMTKSFNETFLTGPPFFWEASRFLFKSALNLCHDKEGIRNNNQYDLWTQRISSSSSFRHIDWHNGKRCGIARKGAIYRRSLSTRVSRLR